MPQTTRFHLDETCRRALADGLRRRGIDVTTTADVGLLGASDPVQLAHAHSQGRVLFTHDADFIALHHGGVPHSGVVYCHQYRHPLGEVIRRLVSLWASREAAELVGQLVYL
jgi:predicted nuclease of predicted toxin-antitoxin system